MYNLFLSKINAALFLNKGVFEVSKNKSCERVLAHGFEKSGLTKHGVCESKTGVKLSRNRVQAFQNSNKLKHVSRCFVVKRVSCMLEGLKQKTDTMVSFVILFTKCNWNVASVRFTLRLWSHRV